MTEVDPSQLPLAELRAVRAQLQNDEDAVSYVRRLAQARLDLIAAEVARRGSGDSATVEGRLASILGSHLTGGGPARPPRPAVDASDHPLALELEQLWGAGGGTDLAALDGDALAALRDDLHAFEQERSSERRALFGRIDALSAELVRRYRDGEADIDGLLADD
ncbi:MAG: hypothetical protein RI958_3309 [Actinomycetota bacterium]|jgi:hypothetical protein